MKSKLKVRARSSNLELLGGVPADALRRLKEIAAAADLPLQRVFRDVVAIGVSVVSDPLESPYQSLIAFRAGLAQKQAEYEHVAGTKGTPAGQARDSLEPRKEPEPGGVLLTLAPEHLTVPDEQDSTSDGSNDAFERPGFESEDQADSGLFTREG